MLKLKPRLSMAAAMVREGVRLADIGTDHAYLTVSLLLDGTVSFAVAADLRKGPLDNALSTVTTYDMQDKVSLRLSDGLQGISPDEVDDIVIAGMGGILIAEILIAAPWVKDKTKRLILQPQSHDEDVRRYLYTNGFRIIEEKACFEDGKVYICICAEYTGEIENHSEAEILLGSFLNKKDEASREFVRKKLIRIRTRLRAIMSRNEENDEILHLKAILQEAERCQQ